MEFSDVKSPLERVIEILAFIRDSAEELVI